MTKIRNPVLMAAQNQLPGLVLAILAHRMAPQINVNDRGDDGTSALGHLLQSGFGEDTPAAVAALIKAGAQIDAIEPDISPPTTYNLVTRQYDPLPPAHTSILALRHHRSPWRELYAALGANRLLSLSGSLPLLHEALARRNHDAAQMLVDIGADVNREDPYMGLPISKCCTSPSFAMMVNAGAKLTLADSQGRTALQVLTSSNLSQELLSMAVMAAQSESQGQTAMFREGQKQRPCLKMGREISQPLIESLFGAVYSAQTERINSLWKTLNMGRDNHLLLEARDTDGRSLLHAAFASRNFPLAKKLLGRGMNVNAFDHSGETPLSIFLALTYDRKERDLKGLRRKKILAEMLPLADWSALSENGLGYFDALFTKTLERQNRFDSAKLWQLLKPHHPDWLTWNPSGESFFLARAARQAVNERYAPGNSLMSEIFSESHFHITLSMQIDRSDFTSAHAKGLLQAMFSRDVDSAMSAPQSLFRDSSSVIESRLDHFITLGVDPESIDWSPKLPAVFPTLSAAIEKWRIQGVVQQTEAPRIKTHRL